MEIPIQLVAAAFAAILAVQGWQVSALYRIASRIQALEAALDAADIKRPALHPVL